MFKFYYCVQQMRKTDVQKEVVVYLTDRKKQVPDLEGAVESNPVNAIQC